MNKRAKVSQEQLRIFFRTLKQNMGYSWEKIATKICGVSMRTLSDWRNGKCTMPLKTIRKLAEFGNTELPKKMRLLERYWYTRLGGEISGRKNFEKYGNFGTPEGRKLGALRAIRTHEIKNTGFFVKKEIALPPHSTRLAECIGIILGDGGLTKKQLTITLHRYDDKDYIAYVYKLCRTLFGVNPSLSYRRKEVVCNVVISRMKLVSFLENMGLCTGNKVKHQVGVPNWITRNDLYSKYCLRGLFDTDGCFYIDRHKHKNNLYLNCAMNFTNRSIPLLNFFKNKLKKYSFHPTQKTSYSIFMRREDEIIRYFQEIGCSNLKHKSKYTKYFKRKYGRVPKWS